MRANYIAQKLLNHKDKISKMAKRKDIGILEIQ